MGCVLDASLQIVPPNTRRPMMRYMGGLLCIITLNAAEVKNEFTIIASNQVHNKTERPLFFKDSVTVVNSHNNQNVLIIALHLNRDLLVEDNKIFDRFLPTLKALQKRLGK